MTTAPTSDADAIAGRAAPQQIPNAHESVHHRSRSDSLGASKQSPPFGASGWFGASTSPVTGYFTAHASSPIHARWPASWSGPAGQPVSPILSSVRPRGGSNDSAFTAESSNSSANDPDPSTPVGPSAPSPFSSADGPDGVSYTGGAALGKTTSFPLTSHPYSQDFGTAHRRMSSGSGVPAGGVGSLQRWSTMSGAPDAGARDEDGGGASRLGGLLRKLSISGRPFRSTSMSSGPQSAGPVPPSSLFSGGTQRSSPPALEPIRSQPESPELQARPPQHTPSPVPLPASATPDQPSTGPGASSPGAKKPSVRGRRQSVGNSMARRPSPHGERLLMGHFEH